MTDTVDEISGGRLILGLGAGWYEPEFRAFGYPFNVRMGRFEEALKIATPPYSADAHSTFGGSIMQHYQVQELALHPRGPRPGGPPLLTGARIDRRRPLRLAAQYDAFQPALDRLDRG